MIERVDGVGGLQPIKGPQGKKVEKSSGKVEKKGSEEIVSTDAGRVVEKFMEKVKEVPEVREKLVEELREAIRNGLYSIDVEGIARKLLEEGG